MPRFAANLSMMFTDLPFLDRFGAAAEAGFKAVEFLFPYEFPAEVVAERLQRHGLLNALFNFPPGNWGSGERGITCHPDRVEEFRAGVQKALAYAAALGTKKLHAMAGIAPAGADPDKLRETYIANLKFAAAQCAPRGILVVMEAINLRDIPGFYLNTQQQSFELMQAADAPNLKMQMDCYHMQVQEGDVATKLRKYAAHCGHVQIAGAPERNEPNTGELRYEYIFDLLDQIGYDGWIGCEYKPAGKTVDGLDWFQAFRS